MLRIYPLVVLLFSLFGIMGCATTATPEQAALIAQKPMITDPLEPINRSMYNFNKTVDTVLIKPLAQGYRAITPDEVRTGVGNFFLNVDEVPVFANKVLQARFKEAGVTIGRFAINTTVGVLGLFDVASKWGMERQQGDFGQTLYVWGVKRSPYIVLPILGPTTIRDGVGKGIDYYLGLWDLASADVQLAAYGLYAVHIRSNYLDQAEVLKTAFDEYAFVRDIYIQQRVGVLLRKQGVTDWDEDLIDEHMVY
jgi:phospholipid-binding lipoprotein MlaA